jgi:ubiquinone/menaquinone biosynthesis C-methylase UbiE
MLKKIRLFIDRHLQKDKDPEKAYDIWAASYDDQPDNLMLSLDEAVFSSLLQGVSLEGKTLADIGCGTGRHWQKIADSGAKKIIGFDVSMAMLAVLQKKFPAAQTYQLKDNTLKELLSNSCDVLISTLTIAHIEKAEEALEEWTRVLKPRGEIIITDYHPEALAKGGKRTFSNNTHTIAIKNYVHSLDKLIAIARQLGFELVRLEERKIDHTHRHYYEKQQAEQLFDRWNGTNIIYGILLKKQG